MVSSFNCEIENITMKKAFGSKGRKHYNTVRPHSALGNPSIGGIALVRIPHSWQQSLVDDARAFEYKFTIEWSENLQIIVRSDFSKFMIYGEGISHSLD